MLLTVASLVLTLAAPEPRSEAGAPLPIELHVLNAGERVERFVPAELPFRVSHAGEAVQLFWPGSDPLYLPPGGSRTLQADLHELAPALADRAGLIEVRLGNDATLRLVRVVPRTLEDWTAFAERVFTARVERVQPERRVSLGDFGCLRGSAGPDVIAWPSGSLPTPGARFVLFVAGGRVVHVEREAAQTVLRARRAAARLGGCG